MFVSGGILSIALSLALFLRGSFVPPLAGNFTSYIPKIYVSEDSLPGNSAIVPWGKVVFDGYGKVVWNEILSQLTMSPKVSTKSDETHAALVVSRKVMKQPFQLSYTMQTTKQLRVGSPANPWEVGWMVFGYQPDGKFKYLILKPDGYGLELGESLLNDVQNFLYTSPKNQDLFPINTPYNVDMIAKNNVISLSVNGKAYPEYTLSKKDRLTPDGRFGFYTEDATVKVSNIVVKQL